MAFIYFKSFKLAAKAQGGGGEGSTKAGLLFTSQEHILCSTLSGLHSVPCGSPDGVYSSTPGSQITSVCGSSIMAPSPEGLGSDF